MQNRLRQSAQEMAADAAPWRRGIPWYLIAIEAAVAMAIGLYLIVDPDAAQSTIRQLIAAILIVISLFDILSGFTAYRDPMVRDPMTPFRLVRGGGGLAIGLLALVATRWNWMAEAHIREVLGYGLVAYGAVGVVGILASWSNRRVTWATVGGNLLSLALGFVLIYNAQQDVGVRQSTLYLGYAALIGGIVLAIYAVILYRHDAEEVATTREPSRFENGGAPAVRSDGPGSSDPMSPERPA